MNKVQLSLLSLALLVSACTSANNIAATNQVQTQEYNSNMSTALAGTMTAVAPTATSIPTSTPQPTATNTPNPSPTASGKFEFFDVAVKQINDNEADVTFGFQIQKGISLNNLMIGANPEGCTNVFAKLSFEPYVPSDFSGIVSEQDSVKMHYRNTGKCNASGVTLFIFRNGGGNLFSKTFDATFSLEMK